MYRGVSLSPVYGRAAHLRDFAKGMVTVIWYLFYHLLSFTRHQPACSVLFPATNHVTPSRVICSGSSDSLPVSSTYSSQLLRATQGSLHGRKGAVC